MTPTVLFYWLGFNWIKNKKVSQNHQSSFLQNSIHKQIERDMTQNNEANINLILSKENFLLIFPKIWWFSFNLSIVRPILFYL